MATYTKTIEDSSKRITTDTDVSGVYTMGRGQYLNFTKIDPISSSTFSQNKYNSLWSMLNLYSTRNYNQLNTNYGTDGGVIGTLLEPVLSAYTEHGMVMFSIDETQYRKFINGSDIELQIPLTGSTSATTLYSSYINTESLKTRLTKSNCDPIALDMIYAEANPEFTEKFGIGYTYQVGTNPQVVDPRSNVKNNNIFYNSGVVYMMSDDWQPWSGSSTGTSWSSGFNVVNKYTKNSARLIEPIGDNRDSVAGVFFIHSGLGFVWAKDFVENFDWSSATGGTGTTEVSFSTDRAFFNASDVDTSTSLNITITLNPNEFNESLNPSYVDDSIENGGNCNVSYNTVTINDVNGNCLAVAKSDEPIIKIDGDYSIMNLVLPIDPMLDSLDTVVGIVNSNA